MQEATLGQGNQVLNLIRQHNVSKWQMQQLLGSGIFETVFHLNPGRLDHTAFNKLIAHSAVLRSHGPLIGEVPPALGSFGLEIQAFKKAGGSFLNCHPNEFESFFGSQSEASFFCSVVLDEAKRVENGYTLIQNAGYKHVALGDFLRIIRTNRYQFPPGKILALGNAPDFCPVLLTETLQMTLLSRGDHQYGRHTKGVAWIPDDMIILVHV